MVRIQNSNHLNSTSHHFNFNFESSPACCNQINSNSHCMGIVLEQILQLWILHKPGFRAESYSCIWSYILSDVFLDMKALWLFNWQMIKARFQKPGLLYLDITLAVNPSDSVSIDRLSGVATFMCDGGIKAFLPGFLVSVVPCVKR